MIKHEEAIKKINEFRNRHYNDNDEELRDVAQALNVVLPKTIKVLERAKKVEELLTKIKDILALNYSYQEIGIKIERLFKEEMK